MNIDLNTELKKAMLAKDKLALSCIRAVKTILTNSEKDKGNAKTTPLQVIKKQIKQREESIIQYKKGNREDLIEKEQAEINYLSTFLPDAISYDDVLVMVKELTQGQEITRKDTGRIIKEVAAKTSGAAESKDVARAVGTLF